MGVHRDANTVPSHYCTILAVWHDDASHPGGPQGRQTFKRSCSEVNVQRSTLPKVYSPLLTIYGQWMTGNPFLYIPKVLEIRVCKQANVGVSDVSTDALFCTHPFASVSTTTTLCRTTGILLSLPYSDDFSIAPRPRGRLWGWKSLSQDGDGTSDASTLNSLDDSHYIPFTCRTRLRLLNNENLRPALSLRLPKNFSLLRSGSLFPHISCTFTTGSSVSSTYASFARKPSQGGRGQQSYGDKVVLRLASRSIWTAFAED